MTDEELQLLAQTTLTPPFGRTEDRWRALADGYLALKIINSTLRNALFVEREERPRRVEAERDLLRVALVKLVGVDGRAELSEMEAVMRLMPAPAEDKAATIDAIHALIATAVDTVKAEAK